MHRFSLCWITLGWKPARPRPPLPVRNHINRGQGLQLTSQFRTVRIAVLYCARREGLSPLMFGSLRDEQNNYYTRTTTTTSRTTTTTTTTTQGHRTDVKVTNLIRGHRTQFSRTTNRSLEDKGSTSY